MTEMIDFGLESRSDRAGMINFNRFKDYIYIHRRCPSAAGKSEEVHLKNSIL